MSGLAHDVEDCPSAEGQHCRHWYDGEACCRCAASEMSDAQKREQGMIE